MHSHLLNLMRMQCTAEHIEDEALSLLALLTPAGSTSLSKRMLNRLSSDATTLERDEAFLRLLKRLFQNSDAHLTPFGKAVCAHPLAAFLMLTNYADTSLLNDLSLPQAHPCYSIVALTSNPFVQIGYARLLRPYSPQIDRLQHVYSVADVPIVALISKVHRDMCRSPAVKIQDESAPLPPGQLRHALFQKYILCEEIRADGSVDVKVNYLYISLIYRRLLQLAQLTGPPEIVLSGQVVLFILMIYKLARMLSFNFRYILVTNASNSNTLYLMTEIAASVSCEIEAKPYYSPNFYMCKQLKQLSAPTPCPKYEATEQLEQIIHQRYAQESTSNQGGCLSSILSPLASRRAVATPVMSQPEPPRTQLRKSGLQTVHLHNSDLSADTPSSETSSFTDQSQTVAHQLPLMQPGDA